MSAPGTEARQPLAAERHYFSPDEADRDTCVRCGKNFRSPTHLLADAMLAERAKGGAE